MTEYEDMGEPVKVIWDSGYNLVKLLSLENRKKVRERVENPNILTGNDKLKELLAEFGIVVIPEKMTNWYFYEE